MDEYSKHLVNKFYEKYDKRKFDQIDVAFFIVTIRDYTSKNSIFRELGDFIAHPMLKDRGMVISTIQPAVDYIDNNYLNMRKGIRPSLQIPYGLATLDDMANVLSQIFKSINLNVTIKRDDINFREFIFCIIFMIGNYKIKLNNRICDIVVYSGNALKLTAFYNLVENERYYCELDILFLANIYTKPLNFDKKKMKNHIARRFDNGYLVAIPYNYDRDEILSGKEDLPRNQYFPIFFA